MDKARTYGGKDSVISRIREAINHDMQVELKLFDDLLEKNKISPAFYKNASYETRYYYAAVTAFVIFSEYALHPSDKQKLYEQIGRYL